MTDFIEDILLPITIGILILATALFGLVSIGQWFNITFVDNVPVKVFVDGNMIYEGTSAGVATDSNGYATKVTITGGYLYLFPQKYYVSKDVEVRGEKP